MKLFDVPRNNYIKIIDKDIKLPIGNYFNEKNGRILFFNHIDGMYSLCEDSEGNYVHLVAWTEVEIVSDDEFKSQS